jgi:GR25 family glycosyltransferase involved in LPS biosynthesis
LGRGRAALGEYRVAPLYTRHESAAAYVLSRAGAERYLALSASKALPADYVVFPKNPRRLGLRVFQLTPAIAIQDHLRRPEEGARQFPTAMTGEEPRRKRPRSAAQTIVREGARLFGQVADLRESIYLRMFLKPKTATVGVGSDGWLDRAA